MDLELKVLCLCTNNFFRSQITEHLLRARGFRSVRSAGTASAYLGIPPSPLVLKAIADHGGTCATYAARQLAQEDVDWADIILCAENSHADCITAHYRWDYKLLVIMGISDCGVDSPECVSRVADRIAKGIDRWN